ncbi:ROK family glucokinase [Clostridiaceae bacterium OttesenSCG-928-D20]|nr:ROK family glucokinase [Clostridiaceae bacterium OttesenSCG-928-D20]
MKYGFGVDVGGTTIKFGFFDLDGDMLNSWDIPTDTSEGGKNILPSIRAEVIRFVIEKHIDKDALIGLGIGVPGPVSEDGVINRCVNLGWGVFNIENELSGMLDLRVKAGNDANAAALGEMWRGGGEGFSNLVMLTLGTGIGGGIIHQGKILTGAHGAAAEFGHMPLIREEKRQCNCGKVNCLETYASGINFAKTAKIRLITYPKKSLLSEVENLETRHVFDCAEKGDELSLSLVDELGDLLGSATAIIASVCDPEIFVIGGGVSKAGMRLLNAIEESFKENVFFPCKDTKFALARLGGDAGKYGAMKLLI